MTRVVSSKSESSKSEKSAKARAAEFESPAEEDIRILAYDLYEKRQAAGAAGSAMTDWMEAERQLLGDTRSLQD
jgi:hypothetical protein